MNDDLPTECPICLEPKGELIWDSNVNHEIQSTCQHWFCVYCLEECLSHRIIVCPLCRGDIHQLIHTFDVSSDEDEESEHEESEDNVNHQ